MQLLRICLARAGRSKIVDLLPWQQLILDLSKVRQLKRPNYEVERKFYVTQDSMLLS